MTERTFIRGLHVPGPNDELGLTADQSAQYLAGDRRVLPPGVEAYAEAQGVLEPLKGKAKSLKNLIDPDGGGPGGDAGALASPPPPSPPGEGVADAAASGAGGD